MNINETVKELFEPTFEAVGDSELSYDKKRTVLYNLYCFACAIYPDYVATPHNTLFEYGCCFLIEPNRHPDYDENNPAFKPSEIANDALEVGGRWYARNGKKFIKFDYGSPLYEKLMLSKVIPPQDREPIPMLSLYAAVYLVCNMFKEVRPLWYTYYFYLDATNEPVDEEFDGKLFELLHTPAVYDGAMAVRGSMLIGDESELGDGKLGKFYLPFIEYRRLHIFDLFEKKMTEGEVEFVAEYSTALLGYYPENVSLMNWNAASRTECIVKTHDEKALDELIVDLKELEEHSETVKKYLKLATLMKKNLLGE